MQDAGLPDRTDREWERALAARFRTGDREAFTLIYQTWSPAIFRFSLHMSGDTVKASEITQDVFVWLIHHPNRFDASRGGLGAFLMGVARRLLLRRWHNENRWLPLEEADSPIAESAETTPVDSRVARLRELIDRLPSRYREVVVLCDLEELSYEEAASILECAVGTVRSRLHRARELLGRKLLAEQQSLGCAL